MLRGKSVVLCVSGGIAAYKAVEVARLLQKAGAVVDVAMTPAATEFVAPLTFQALTGRPEGTILQSGCIGRFPALLPCANSIPVPFGRRAAMFGNSFLYEFVTLYVVLDPVAAIPWNAARNTSCAEVPRPFVSVCEEMLTPVSAPSLTPADSLIGPP